MSGRRGLNLKTQPDERILTPRLKERYEDQAKDVFPLAGDLQDPLGLRDLWLKERHAIMEFSGKTRSRSSNQAITERRKDAIVKIKIRKEKTRRDMDLVSRVSNRGGIANNPMQSRGP